MSGDACGLADGPELQAQDLVILLQFFVNVVVVGREEAKGQPDCIDCQGHPGRLVEEKP